MTDATAGLLICQVTSEACRQHCPSARILHILLEQLLELRGVLDRFQLRPRHSVQHELMILDLMSPQMRQHLLVEDVFELQSEPLDDLFEDRV
jgi:hypothetical protein